MKERKKSSVDFKRKSRIQKRINHEIFHQSVNKSCHPENLSQCCVYCRWNNLQKQFWIQNVTSPRLTLLHDCENKNIGHLFEKFEGQECPIWLSSAVNEFVIWAIAEMQRNLSFFEVFTIATKKNYIRKMLVSAISGGVRCET